MQCSPTGTRARKEFINWYGFHLGLWNTSTAIEVRSNEEQPVAKGQKQKKKMEIKKEEGWGDSKVTPLWSAERIFTSSHAQYNMCMMYGICLHDDSRDIATT